MDNAHDHQIAPGAPDPIQQGVSAPRPLFAADNQVPLTVDGAPPAPLDVARRRFNIFTRVVLPVIILFLGIACIAFVAQQLPSRGKTQPSAQSAASNDDPLVFDNPGYVWDPKDPKYIPEFELGTDGHYDYPFTNSAANDIDLGVGETSCSCGGVYICVFQNYEQRQEYLQAADSPQLTWTIVEVDRELRKHATIPAKATGVLRISWKGNRSEPESLRLTTKVWVRPGAGREVIKKSITVLANYVRAVRFDQEKLDLGTLSPKEERPATFYCWSPTRDLKVMPASEDPCLNVEAAPLSALECEKLQERLRAAGKMTRVRSAAKIKVTLFEEKDGKQLDMGLFTKSVPLTFAASGTPIQEIPLPVLGASVVGDVTLVAGETGGRIDFNFFSAKKGAKKTVTLLAPQGAQLKFVHCDPILLDMDAELKELTTVGNKTQWEMVVTAIPNRDPGLLPENGVVVLRCELPAVGAAPARTRLVRIPVSGTAGSH